jgi:hypothetical protein
MTEIAEKKKKSLVKKIVKWTGITFLLLIITIILIPIFFKEQLKELALREANKMLKADVALGDFDLTFFSTFPNLTLEFMDVSVTGRDEFEGVKLADIKRFEANLGFWSVISGDEVEIAGIRLIEPRFDVRILEDGTANYDIVKTTEELVEEYGEDEAEESAFKLTLSRYSIENGYIVYNDILGAMYAELVNLNHTGRGDLTADVIDFRTKTTMDKLTYRMDGLTYLSEVKTDLDMNILMEFKEGSDKFTLKENELKLNALSLSFDGYYEMLEGYDDMDITLNAQKATFKEILSLVPAFYHTGYEGMIAQGSVELGGFVKGKMTDTDLPGWDFKMNVSNASINYPETPAAIEKINIKSGTTYPGGSNLDRMTVDVSQFTAAFVGNTLDASLSMRNVMTDPYLKSTILAKVDLATLDQVYPFPEGENYNGKLTSDLIIDGKMSALDAGDYESFKAQGTLSLRDFIYKSLDLPDPVSVSEMEFEFSPKVLKLASLTGEMGKTDFHMHGDVFNYMGYLFRSEPLKGNFAFISKNLDLDAFMPESSSEDTAATESESTSDENIEPLLIPGNIDFALKTEIGNMKYDGIEIKNLKGNVIISEEIAFLENLSMETLGGNVGLSGRYNTKNHRKPHIDFSYRLVDLDIQALSENFLTIQKLAPISKHAKGKITTDFTMNADLKPDFEPIYSSMFGSGNFFTKEVQLSNFRPLDRLSEVMDIEDIKNSSFQNIKAFFEFSEGKIHVKPFDFKIKDIKMNILGGSTSFEQEIDYRIRIDVPKSYVPKSILDLAEKAVSAARNIPGFKMKELPAIIPVNALLTNTVSDPKIQTDFREQLMALGGDLKDAIKDLITDKIEEIKDSVKQIVQDKIEDIKDDLMERKQKILDDAQKQADNIVAEARVLARRTREEGDRRAQQIIDEASGTNIVQQRAAERLAEKTRNEANDAANRIEREAQTRADNVMRDARERADKLQ